MLAFESWIGIFWEHSKILGLDWYENHLDMQRYENYLLSVSYIITNVFKYFDLVRLFPF